MCELEGASISAVARTLGLTSVTVAMASLEGAARAGRCSYPYGKVTAVTNELRDQLRDADPLTREPALSADDVHAMRRRIVSAAHAAPRRRNRPVAAGRRRARARVHGFDGVRAAVQIRSRTCETCDRAETGRAASACKFETPGGTRIISVLNPDLEAVRGNEDTMKSHRIRAVGVRARIDGARPATLTRAYRGFSVVLLLGEQQGSVPAEGLSPSALRAIADIKEFLPYKGYRVLDTQWVAGSEHGTSKGRISSLDQKDYEFELSTQPTELGKIAGPNRLALTRPYFTLKNSRDKLSTTNGARWGDVTMLENSFVIKPGETVVVGTSKVQGENALIVLLTAVAAGK